MKLFFQIVFKDLYQFFTNSNYRTFIKFALLYGDKPRYLKDEISFLNYKIEIMDHLSFIWQFKEIFVDEVYKFKAQTDSPLIFDCGANVGISCLYFKKIYPKSRIKAFEPDPEIAGVLSRNLRDTADVEVVNKAIWKDNDGVDISLEGADAASIYSNKNKIKVPSVRLKELIDNEERIDMLKIDIEGAEIDVIKDCSENLNKAENVFIEYHSFLNQTQELNSILEILTKNNFRYFIKQSMDRNTPFINRSTRSYPELDLQLNIFAYKL